MWVERDVNVVRGWAADQFLPTPLATNEPPLDLLPIGLGVATRRQLQIKRALDVVVGLALLLIAVPLLALVALAVGLTSRGPVLFRQERVGHHGRRFVALKFRSMRLQAHEQRRDYLGMNECTGPVFKIRKDPRITRVGRLIRKLSLDELPQLVNVVCGDMSLVGPRPPLPEEYETYDAYQRARLQVKPGLTCTWQVSGRSTIPFEDWIEMDLAYIRSWNLRLDLVLLLKTIPAVLLRRGAW